MSYWEASGQSDEWYTPKYIFTALGCRFDLDVAAPPEGPRHVPADRWISKDSLDETWSGFVWMNPPFGGRNGLIPWLEKFSEHGNGIALTPDRTSAPWWQDFSCLTDAVLFVSPKIRFEKPDGSVGKSPGSGTTLWACGKTGVRALQHAERFGLGVSFNRPAPEFLEVAA